jgi:hypothetical protein
MAIEEKPSRNEDEYFAKQNAELLKAKRAQLDAERAKAAALSQSTMRCPKDGAELKERLFHSVKIDGCPQCNGVWLDPGELEILAMVDRNPVSRVFGDFIKGLR